MSGFPTRIARSSLGPTLENKWPVVNPKQDIGDKTFNLAFHQIAGMNVVSARGLLFVSYNSETNSVTTDYQGFAWDPDGMLPRIVWTRNDAGIYSFILPQASYPDEEGNDVIIELIGGIVHPQRLFNEFVVTGHYIKTGVRSGQVHIVVPTINAHRDADFLLLFW